MIRRNIQDSVQRAMADTPVVLLNGARQTGKTTLAQALAAKSGAQYFTLDDAATLALAAGDPAELKWGQCNFPGAFALNTYDTYDNGRSRCHGEHDSTLRMCRSTSSSAAITAK